MITLSPLSEADMMVIRRWRNDQMDVLRQDQPIGEAAQRTYYRTHVAPQYARAQPTQLLYAVHEGDALVAYGGLVHMNWYARAAEVSFLADTAIPHESDRHDGLFRAFLARLLDRAESLGLVRLTAELYDLRPRHGAALSDCGFKLERRHAGAVHIRGQAVDSLFYGRDLVPD
ncbi:GNAT family N-acetyltransferase [Yunchengibacter salinarum]|uniref:GNAT family N-acetyltransferase n=1 Tax=Yunchengibacter salinarum TaxID=3133399 RepID=UPI0035B6627A